MLGVIYAMPTVDVNKANQIQTGVASNALERFQGLTPRAKLMLGVGYDDDFSAFFVEGQLLRVR